MLLKLIFQVNKHFSRKNNPRAEILPKIKIFQFFGARENWENNIICHFWAISGLFFGKILIHFLAYIDPRVEISPRDKNLKMRKNI